MDIEWFKLAQSHTMHFELYYSKTVDWCLRIYKKGCGDNGSDIEICDEQSCDLSYVLAKGEVAIKEWLLKNNGATLFGDDSVSEPSGNRRKSSKKDVANSRAAASEQRMKEREASFREECYGFAGEFGREMVERFIEYWTEPNKSKTSMRYELERTWDTHRRMLTWSRKSYNQPSVAPERKSISVDEALRRAYGKH